MHPALPFEFTLRPETLISRFLPAARKRPLVAQDLRYPALDCLIRVFLALCFVQQGHKWYSTAM